MSVLKIWFLVLVFKIGVSSHKTISTNNQFWSSPSHLWNLHVPFDSLLIGFTPYRAIEPVLGLELKIKNVEKKKRRFKSLIKRQDVCSHCQAWTVLLYHAGKTGHAFLFARPTGHPKPKCAPNQETAENTACYPFWPL